ncbi:DUF402 domain-containing protein [Falsibacillus albus]|nr:DUF402 domain-containing protein [Falsibacillus albus]
MKKKYGDRLDWKRVKQRNYHVRVLGNHGNLTYETRLDLQKVSPSLYVQYDQQRICIAADGYTWIQWFRFELPYTLTAMIDETGKVVQYYYDLCFDQGFDAKRNSPWYLDAYLDLVLLPDKQMYILDEDDLEEAVNTKQMSSDQAQSVQVSLHHLIHSIQSSTEPLLQQYQTCSD